MGRHYHRNHTACPFANDHWRVVCPCDCVSLLVSYFFAKLTASIKLSENLRNF